MSSLTTHHSTTTTTTGTATTTPIASGGSGSGRGADINIGDDLDDEIYTPLPTSPPAVAVPLVQLLQLRGNNQIVDISLSLEAMLVRLGYR